MTLAVWNVRHHRANASLNGPMNRCSSDQSVVANTIISKAAQNCSELCTRSRSQSRQRFETATRES